jgi:hypothetical protein
MSWYKINGGLMAFPAFHVGADVLFGSPLVKWLDFDCGPQIVEDGMVTGRMAKGIKLREEGTKVHLAEFLAELAALVALAPDGTQWCGCFVVKGRGGLETLYSAHGRTVYVQFSRIELSEPRPICGSAP